MTSDAALVKVYGQDDGVLSRLKTRSEFRKSRGLVKMNSREICERNLILDAEWALPEVSEPSEDEDEDEEMVDFYGNDGDDEDEEGENEEDSNEEEDEEDDEEEQEEGESEIEPSLPPSNRKRLAEPPSGTTAPPKKRVAFGLQKPAKVAGLPLRSAPPKSNLKKPTLTPKKRR